MVHSPKHVHEKTARRDVHSPDLNILISSSVTQGKRGMRSLVCDNYTIVQRTIYHVLSEFHVNERHEWGSFFLRQAMIPNTSYPRKRSFRINSIADYRYWLSSHTFPSLITRDWYGSLAIGNIRCIPITMLTEAKIEYYSSIGPSAAEEHDGNSIFLHIIVFRSLDNGLPRASVMECTQKTLPCL